MMVLDFEVGRSTAQVPWCVTETHDIESANSMTLGAMNAEWYATMWRSSWKVGDVQGLKELLETGVGNGAFTLQLSLPQGNTYS